MFAVLSPIRPTQYELLLTASHDIPNQHIDGSWNYRISYPTTVNSLEPSVNFWPEIPTKPLGAGVGALPADDEIVLGDEGDETVVGGGLGTLVAVPTRHCE